MNHPPVELYDTTLRDGAQAEGVSFSVLDKLKIARRLDEFGIHYIEGGWPGSNPKDEEFFALAQKEQFKNAQLCAFSMTRRANIEPQDDANLQTIVAANTPVVMLVGKSWDFHVTEALQSAARRKLAHDRKQRALGQVAGATRVFHRRTFFRCAAKIARIRDENSRSRRQLAAPNCSLCPIPTAAPCPRTSATACGRCWKKFDLPVGIHTHNDCELAVANALAGVEAGATQVQGVINGFRRTLRQLQSGLGHRQLATENGSASCLAMRN